MRAPSRALGAVRSGPAIRLRPPGWSVVLGFSHPHFVVFRRAEIREIVRENGTRSPCGDRQMSAPSPHAFLVNI